MTVLGRAWWALLVLGCVLAAAWPLRDALLRGEVAGAGPDVANTLWGMWWFSVDGAQALLTGTTEKANHPHGLFGNVLAPLHSVGFAIMRVFAGTPLAATLISLVTLAGLSVASAWLARGLGLGPWGVATAGLGVFVARYPHFAAGETSVVGITALPAVLGLGAWVRGWPAVTAVCAGFTATEYPYLVPLLPTLLLWRALQTRERRWILAFGGALLLAWLGTRFVGYGQVPSFSPAPRAPVGFLRLAVPVVEERQARSSVLDLLLPGPVVWSLDVGGSKGAEGRDYLGLSLLALAALNPKRVLLWLGLAAGATALATGSDWGGLPGPFGLLNLLAAELVRPLTQPTRYLVLANVCLAVAAAAGVERLGRLAPVALAAVAVDALLLGGLSLRLPVTSLPAPACLASLSGRAGVVTWPWDGLENGVAAHHSRMLQLVHQQPSPTFGVGSWTLLNPPAVAKTLLARGFRADRPIPVDVLLGLDYDTLVVDLSGGPPPLQQGLPAPVARCPGFDIYFLR